ncbi:MAG: GNAT family N-acetyltransferase [Planctomycetota bacterium]
MDPTLAPPPHLRSERLELLLPLPQAAPRLLRYLEDNRAHHAPFNPPPPPGYYTLDHWRARLAQNRQDWRDDKAVRFVLFRRGEVAGPVLGVVNLTQIHRGPMEAALLGYSLDQDAVGHGYMQEALSAALDYAFTTLGLHRVMANYLPTNERSGRVLRRLGFTVEGYARDYLYIDGAWRDHVLTALTSPHPRPPAMCESA